MIYLDWIDIPWWFRGVIFYFRSSNRIQSEESCSIKKPPTPPVRQGSSLSSNNIQANDINNSETANNSSSISFASQLRGGFDEQSTCNDQVKVFEAIEGTPLNFSTATSFSDLTVDEIGGSVDGRVTRDPDDGLIQLHSNGDLHGLDDTEPQR